MAQVSYEYTGRRFGEEQSSRFNESINRDYYLANCEVQPESSNIYIRNSRTQAGFIPISMHQSVGVKTVTRRTCTDFRSDNHNIFLIWVPIRGSVEIVQNGRSSVVESGNVAISSSSDPFCIKTAGDDEGLHQSLQVLAPGDLVSRMLLRPKRFCALPFATMPGGLFVAKELFVSLYDMADLIDRQQSEALALSGIGALLSSIRESAKGELATPSVQQIKLQRLLDYVELHHCDAELTTESVATACGMSVRYLHYLLKSGGHSFSDFLWSTRLNNAFALLKDPMMHGTTVAEIAYSCGFKSGAHFSRTFRDHFGCSPREVREAAASQPS